MKLNLRVIFTASSDLFVRIGIQAKDKDGSSIRLAEQFLMVRENDPHIPLT